MELNETEVTLYHAPTPPSYWTIDLVDAHPGEKRYPGLMGLHALFMGLAFFGALPIGIALRSVKHAWHGVTVFAFYGFVVLGLSTSALYQKLTPNMYEGSKHGVQGYWFLFFAVLISAFDVFAFVLRFIAYVNSIRKGEDKFALKAFWNYVILGRDEHLSGSGAEYTNLVVEDPEDLDDAELKVKEVDVSEQTSPRRARIVEPIQTQFEPSEQDNDETESWANDVHHHRQPSYPHSWSITDKRSLLRRIGRGVFATAERSLVFAGLWQVISGVVIYTGGCRGNYINGCLAHLIKGAIFWCYGLVTFARYLGSFSELGWAWNRAPFKQYPSAEFVESLVIFVYGITNTWMERFGAHPGDPYTTKQVQHISIAVMFWFAGLVGMGIESKRVRRWLASGSTAAVPKSRRSQEAVAEPPSYVASFNPFPALVIGVTGSAMSAHFQTYIFQVQIHVVWGTFLAAFAVFRCLTYFFLWLGPPRSILPSRPPTEALASFFLACGGLEFMFSTEELTIAAMRQGHDDVMMFVCVGVAMTCFAFCWALGLVAFKGWLKSHTHAAVNFHSSA
ncbi:putative membrane protein C3B8.06 [Grifola frondosa]|uniref:Putative membrane protein C3B8.06 n=1 Tax=Grifola frondosa TaxID=5627 RepID=A0A1C7MHK1_GRIFR|nr:putative membrane protein C3B8.06 [Grifola frondosa]